MGIEGPTRRHRLRGVLVVAGAAIAVAVGVGLLPHLVKAGLGAGSVLSILLLAGGIAGVVLGARWALADRHPVGKVAGVGAALVPVLLAVAVIGPAVAASYVPATSVTRSPEALRLDHEPVTLRTADGVELAGWYLPGDGGAGVVMLHGSGSTRSAVLDQAAALAGRGVSVLLVDARGHGASDGTAQDFGWYGDLDVTAAVDHLASRSEIDVGRIGVVGFSMGGEEAIGAAATDPRIRAVVAEGATARQAADKEWFSEVYGWRGGIQERLEAVQYAVADVLTAAGPPLALRSAVTRADGTDFLLITAGGAEDERHAASHIRGGAPERVEVWEVEGAGHVAGYRTDPDEWTRRVDSFLDEHLG